MGETRNVSNMWEDKNQFIKAQKGGSLLNKAINNLPFEMHLPGHNFTGPGTKLN